METMYGYQGQVAIILFRLNTYLAAKEKRMDFEEEFKEKAENVIDRTNIALKYQKSYIILGLKKKKTFGKPPEKKLYFGLNTP